MKSVILTALACLLVSSLAHAEKQFPGYLNDKYCDSIKMDFMTGAIKSLQRYRDKQLVSQHRGGMHNINKYISQRKDWLQECDEFLLVTSQQRLFKDKQTTGDIFNAMASVSKELDSLIKGVTYTVDAGGTPTDVAAEKFDRLFKLVEAHQTMMLLKGQVVYR
ncbi:hypothetical protein HBA55_30745 [Pseudomaricurvus alkylphenolicus]|jgi:hypothetical protein|uniref:hypothetical protein n=1 Tax=Pseudomaricurvus alkylphenolicus TaxID=1306991 RepID=UPI00141DE362|nr:hypothetical protein [Pseudomaricurvus alkylphenolicus]NIB44020.1 hypothetical protein [Pseudomaricurvus alkylphenolicus]